MNHGSHWKKWLIEKAEFRLVTWDEVFRSIELLRGITSNQIGLIELNSSLDIDIVTKIFIRVNSEGVPLSQADFAMSKIAVNEAYGGNHLRKAIDYFCHLAVAPEFYSDCQWRRKIVHLWRDKIDHLS